MYTEKPVHVPLQIRRVKTVPYFVVPKANIYSDILQKEICTAALSGPLGAFSFFFFLLYRLHLAWSNSVPLLIGTHCTADSSAFKNTPMCFKTLKSAPTTQRGNNHRAVRTHKQPSTLSSNHIQLTAFTWEKSVVGLKIETPACSSDSLVTSALPDHDTEDNACAK